PGCHYLSLRTLLTKTLRWRVWKNGRLNILMWRNSSKSTMYLSTLCAAGHQRGRASASIFGMCLKRRGHRRKLRTRITTPHVNGVTVFITPDGDTKSVGAPGPAPRTAERC